MAKVQTLALRNTLTPGSDRQQHLPTLPRPQHTVTDRCRRQWPADAQRAGRQSLRFQSISGPSRPVSAAPMRRIVWIQGFGTTRLDPRFVYFAKSVRFFQHRYAHFIFTRHHVTGREQTLTLFCSCSGIRAEKRPFRLLRHTGSYHPDHRSAASAMTSARDFGDVKDADRLRSVLSLYPCHRTQTNSSVMDRRDISQGAAGNGLIDSRPSISVRQASGWENSVACQHHCQAHFSPAARRRRLISM